MLLAHLAVAKHRQQQPGDTSDAALHLLVLDPCLTSQPELQAVFEAGGGLPLYIQAIRSVCEVGGVRGRACKVQAQPQLEVCMVGEGCVLHKQVATSGSANHTVLPACCYQQGPLPYDTAVLVPTLRLQLRPPHASQAVAAELVTSGLHRLLADGGTAARCEGQGAEELVRPAGWVVPSFVSSLQHRQFQQP